jgi:hypothetical protein
VAFNLLTIHLAPRQIVVAFDLEFNNRLSVSDIEHFEAQIRQKHPEVVAVFGKPKGQPPRRLLS